MRLTSSPITKRASGGIGSRRAGLPSGQNGIPCPCTLRRAFSEACSRLQTAARPARSAVSASLLLLPAATTAILRRATVQATCPAGCLIAVPTFLARMRRPNSPPHAAPRPARPLRPAPLSPNVLSRNAFRDRPIEQLSTGRHRAMSASKSIKPAISL